MLLKRLNLFDQLLAISLGELRVGANLALKLRQLLLSLGHGRLDSLTLGEYLVLGIRQHEEQQARECQGRKRPQEGATRNV